MSEWIRCSDRMPPRLVRVLLGSRYDGPVVGRLTGTRADFWSVDGQDEWDPLSYWAYWMPLPAVPTE